MFGNYIILLLLNKNKCYNSVYCKILVFKDNLYKYILN